MEETNTPVADISADTAQGAAEPARRAAPPPNGAAKKRPNRRRKKIRNRIIAVVVVLAIGLGTWYGMSRLLADKEESGEIENATVSFGSIQSFVSGGGSAKAKDAATLTLLSGGTVIDVFVSDGQQVTQGDPLYVVESAEAQRAVEDAQAGVEQAQEAVVSAQDNIASIEEQIAEIRASYGDLTVTAPFSGILYETADIDVGDAVSSGMVIAKLADDSEMELELYFNYAYEHEIAVGQAATVSIPSAMNEVAGTVTEINYVRRISAEGAMLFQAVVSIPNPGALGEGMGASAYLTGAGGEMIYPYDAGELRYARTAEIKAEASGEVVSASLLDYEPVSAGKLLMTIGAQGNDDGIRALERSLKTAQDGLAAAQGGVTMAEETLAKAQANLGNFEAFAPMTGTVISCTLLPGEEVEAGRVAVTIADTAVMTVEAKVDEMNVSVIQPGMSCNVYMWDQTVGQRFYGGIVESVSLEAKMDATSGFAYFPAVIRVDNPDGSLRPGMTVNYDMMASQSENCLVVPVQAVKYTPAGTCLYVQAEEKPEGALTMEELGLDEQYTAQNDRVPPGYYAVPVTVGISNNGQAEILDGVQEGAVVFMRYNRLEDPYGGGAIGGGGIMF